MKLGRAEKVALVTITILLIIGLSLSVADLELTYNTQVDAQVCSACHSRVVREWRASPHSSIACSACHYGGLTQLLTICLPGFISGRSASGAPEALSHCMDCHSMRVILAGRLHAAHTSLIGARQCTSCHPAHVDVTSDEQCYVCHPRDKMISVHRSFHEQALAQLSLNKPTCHQCHSSAAPWPMIPGPKCIDGALQGRSCFDCHGVRLPPPDISRFSCLDCHHN